MAHLKDVLSSEVHWQIAEWNVKDQANNRIKLLMGENAGYFAPVFVTHGGYYWTTPDASGWQLLTDADPMTRKSVMAKIDSLRSDLLARFPGQESRVNRIFTYPNDDFVFYKLGKDGSVDLKITGWGFANFNRAQGGTIIETPTKDLLRQVTLSFNVDGIRVPEREFQLMKPMGWENMKTDSEGIFSFGPQSPGIQIRVRDLDTGRESLTEITSTTHHIDVDVTEYVVVRVLATVDGEPLDGAKVSYVYGHRSGEITLQNGVADFRLPWLKDSACRVILNGQEQTRSLVKENVNVFDFSLVNPKPVGIPVIVNVRDNGAGIPGELVVFMYKGQQRQLYTDQNGRVQTEFDLEPDDMSNAPVTATVRAQLQAAPLAEPKVEFNFDFNTPPAIRFDAKVQAVNQENTPMPCYPLVIDTGTGEVSYLTDEEGCVGLTDLLSGETMRVSDGNNMEYYEDFTLDHNRDLYIFRLPYEPADRDPDTTLRVIEISGQPASGVRCILTQDDLRFSATLDEAGEMFFCRDHFSFDKDVTVDLYTPRRPFPTLKIRFEKDENEYELREVDGPTPWWKIVGEIVLALAGIFLLMAYYSFLHGLFSALPNFFA